MARVTIEDCLKKVENRFILIHMAAKRVRQLKNGDAPLVRSKNREVVTALREIAAGKLMLVPKQSEEGKPAQVKKEVEAKSPLVTMSEEELQQTTERAESEANEDQMAAGYDEAILRGEVVAETYDKGPW